jgi:hypothetical protein
MRWTILSLNLCYLRLGPCVYDDLCGRSPAVHPHCDVSAYRKLIPTSRYVCRSHILEHEAERLSRRP